MAKGGFRGGFGGSQANMMKQAQISLLNCWIPIASALLIWGLGVNPVYIILAAGIGGYIYGLFLKPSE